LTVAVKMMTVHSASLSTQTRPKVLASIYNR